MLLRSVGGFVPILGALGMKTKERDRNRCSRNKPKTAPPPHTMALMDDVRTWTAERNGGKGHRNGERAIKQTPLQTSNQPKSSTKLGMSWCYSCYQ